RYARKPPFHAFARPAPACAASCRLSWPRGQAARLGAGSPHSPRSREPVDSGNPDELNGTGVDHLTRPCLRVEVHVLVCTTLSTPSNSHRVATKPDDVRRWQDPGAGKELGMHENDVVSTLNGQEVHPPRGTLSPPRIRDSAPSHSPRGSRQVPRRRE